jgi:hypothetical protein
VHGTRTWNFGTHLMHVGQAFRRGETNGGGQATGHIKEVSNSNDEDMVNSLRCFISGDSVARRRRAGSREADCQSTSSNMLYTPCAPSHVQPVRSLVGCASYYDRCKRDAALARRATLLARMLLIAHCVRVRGLLCRGRVSYVLDGAECLDSYPASPNLVRLHLLISVYV